jgi:3-phosphoshikimate 1-carboxyvinyltransferase
MILTARAGGPLEGVAAVPGDKSCSHRALILGGMADGVTKIHGLLESDDVLATARAVEALGATVQRLGPGEWHVTGTRWVSPDATVDCGNSGTAARLLVGAVAGRANVTATFAGDVSLSNRPMGRVTDPLAQMGAQIDGEDNLPLTVHGTALGGIDYRNVPASAQVKSAILLAGLGSSAPVSVVEPVPSRDHSEIMLAAFGADVAVEETQGGIRVTLGPNRLLTGAEVTVGADPSSAAFPLVAAAIVPGSRVTVCGVNVNPLRTGLYEMLEAMGADIALAKERVQSREVVGDITIAHAPLQPCHVNARQVPAMIDEIPILAVACAFADGESVIEGLAELRVKESDRLGSVVAGLTACGVMAVANSDSLRIFGRGRVRGGGRIVTHGDHRIAMAFLTLGLASEQPVTVDQPGMIATSFPGYVEVMRQLGADIA